MVEWPMVGGGAIDRVDNGKEAVGRGAEGGGANGRIADG